MFYLIAKAHTRSYVVGGDIQHIREGTVPVEI